MSIKNLISAELKGDRVIWAIAALLMIASLLIVYSSSGHLAHAKRGGDTEYYLIRQAGFLLLGAVLMYLCHLMHYMRYSNMAPTLILVAIPLLMYTLFFGPEINDARRWIHLPFINISFQTSDFARLALIIYVARAISGKQDYIKDFQSAFLPIIVPIIIIVGLIAPADLSTAVIIFTTCLIMMFVGRVDMRYIFLLLLCGLLVFVFLIALGQFLPGLARTSTWINRLNDFLHMPEGAFQTQQAEIAIANGGVFGLGPGNSIQRNYLYAANADYIYAIIIEEYGLWGGFIVNALYVGLFIRCTRLITRSPKTFGTMLALGVSLNIVIQALANMAVSVHLIPVAGLTLPMISMGGTSLIFTCVSIGILLSVSKYIEKMS